MLLIFGALVNFSYGKNPWALVYVFIHRVGARISASIFLSDGLDPYILCRKMEKTQFTKEEMDGKVFIAGQKRFLSFSKEKDWITFSLFVSRSRV